MKKVRIDQFLTDNNFYSSREKAKRGVMAGEVYYNTEVVAKASFTIDPEKKDKLEVKKKDHAVSRAYYKIKKGLEYFGVSPESRVCMDMGSSTGGFTQCLLEQGATQVYAVDSGTNQLVYSLRTDPRVKVMERTNGRYLTKRKFETLPTLCVMDVSFISIKKIIPTLKELAVPEIVTLVKPQFEAGRAGVGAGGIVSDPAVHESVLISVVNFAEQAGYFAVDITFSPIKGGKGNIEFLLHLVSEGEHLDFTAKIKEVVQESQRTL